MDIRSSDKAKLFRSDTQMTNIMPKDKIGKSPKLTKKQRKQNEKQKTQISQKKRAIIRNKTLLTT